MIAPMDELELRIATHETAVIEVVAHIDRDHIIAGMNAIREGLVDGAGSDERAIKLSAIQLLEDALHRFDPPAIGLHWPGAV